MVWEKDNIDALIHTQSSTYGTVILSKGEKQTDPWILIYGLQRFSVGTALLYALHAQVLAPDPNNKTTAPYFETLKNQLGTLFPVFEWNHKMLLEHGRKGIKRSYTRLYETICEYIARNLKVDPLHFADDMSQTFLVRQIAIDPYSVNPHPCLCTIYSDTNKEEFPCCGGTSMRAISDKIV